MHKYKNYFDNMKGYYFPLLIVKRGEGVFFETIQEQMSYDRSVLESIGYTNKIKLVKHFVESYGIWNTIHFVMVTMKK